MVLLIFFTETTLFEENRKKRKKGEEGKKIGVFFFFLIRANSIYLTCEFHEKYKIPSLTFKNLNWVVFGFYPKFHRELY